MRFPAQITMQSVQGLFYEYRTPVTALAISLIAGLGVGMLRASNSSDLAEQNERWRLPSMAAPQFTVATPDDMNERFWSERPRELRQKPDVGTVKVLGQWRFIGTIDHGSELLAVIEIEDGKVRRLKTGDTLPDDGVITKILEGEISFDRQGAAQTARLFVEQKSE